MAQRLRRPSPGQGAMGSNDAILVHVGDTLSSPDEGEPGQRLNPAPRHPLFEDSAARSARPSYERSPSSSAGLMSRRGRGAAAKRGGDEGQLPTARDVDGGNTKGHQDNVQTARVTTLDRLEGWFGIAGQSPSSSSSSSASVLPTSVNSVPRRRPTQAAQSQQQPTTRLVLVHSISSMDTLDSLALKYKTNSGTLRRANGLWPGDSIQSRKELFIPLDENDDAIDDGSSGAGPSTGGLPARARATEDVKGKLSLIDVGRSSDTEGAGRKPSEEAASDDQVSVGLIESHERNLSTTSAATSGSTSSAPVLAAAEVRRVPTQAMSYFPTGPSAAGGKGKGRRFDGADADNDGGSSPAFGFALGITQQSDQPQDPGESGVEDLLRLAERARLRGDEGGDTIDSIQNQKPSLVPSTLPSSRRTSGDGPRSESAASVSGAGNDDWKPNKWTFGAPRPRKKESASVSSVTSSPESSNRPVLAALAHPSTSSSVSSSPPRSSYQSGNGSGGGYQGWNDIPEPPLSRTAQGKVAHAYKPNNRRKYPRPDGTFGETVGVAIMDDLVAGLPPNPGPASNWARPIHDCLPLPESSTRRSKVAGHGPSSSPLATSASPGSSSAGWGQLLSDTFRGRIGLDEALERGYEDLKTASLVAFAENSSVRNGAQHYSRINGAHTPQQLSDTPPLRPSAELARATLGRSGRRNVTGSNGPGLEGEAQRDGTGPGSNGTDEAARRGSAKSTHELEELHNHSHLFSSHNGGSSTWSPSMGASPLSHTMEHSNSGSGLLRGRKNVRNVDWTA